MFAQPATAYEIIHLNLSKCYVLESMIATNKANITIYNFPECVTGSSLMVYVLMRKMADLSQTVFVWSTFKLSNAHTLTHTHIYTHIHTHTHTYTHIHTHTHIYTKKHTRTHLEKMHFARMQCIAYRINSGYILALLDMSWRNK